MGGTRARCACRNRSAPSQGFVNECHLCWLLGSSVLRKRRVFRTDVPSSQHREQTVRERVARPTGKTNAAKAFRWKHLTYVAIGIVVTTWILYAIFQKTLIPVLSAVVTLIQTFVSMGIGGWIANAMK